MTFVQDGAQPHAAKATQSWNSMNFPNFIAKEEWPANCPDINLIENLWSNINEEAYKDPIPKTKKELKMRLKEAWKNVSLTILQESSHSMPQRLKNVIKNKEGHADYWNCEKNYNSVIIRSRKNPGTLSSITLLWSEINLKSGARTFGAPCIMSPL